MSAADHARRWARQVTPPLVPTLRSRHAEAMAALERVTFPDEPSETWKYTQAHWLNDARWFRQPPAFMVQNDTVQNDTVHSEPGPTNSILFIGSRCVLPATMATGVRCTRLLDSELAQQQVTVGADDEPFKVLNTATTLDQAIAISITSKSELRLDYLSPAPVAVQSREVPEPAMLATRTVLRVGADLTLVETHRGGGGLRNHVLEIDIAPGATLTHVRLFESDESYLGVTRCDIRIDEAAHYRLVHGIKGATLLREEIRVIHVGEHSSADLRGISIARGKGQADLSLRLLHLARASRSQTQYRCVARERGRVSVLGAIEIPQAAKQIDADLQCKGLLLASTAEINCKPELQIYSDDVRCSHGAAIGQLDEQALFFLRTRGLDEVAARALLLSGFMRTPFARSAPPGREHIEAWITREVISP